MAEFRVLLASHLARALDRQLTQNALFQKLSTVSDCFKRHNYDKDFPLDGLCSPPNKKEDFRCLITCMEKNNGRNTSRGKAQGGGEGF